MESNGLVVNRDSPRDLTDSPDLSRPELHSAPGHRRSNHKKQVSYDAKPKELAPRSHGSNRSSVAVSSSPAMATMDVDFLRGLNVPAVDVAGVSIVPSLLPQN